MRRINFAVTAEELKLLASLASDQLFRRQFIDPRFPGYKGNREEVDLGKALVGRMQSIIDAHPRWASIPALEQRSKREGLMKNIFVGNLSPGTTPAVIRSLFEPLGTIHYFKLMKDLETGLSRGFAFVEMQDAEADSAIAGLDGRVVDGQPIQVREGRPRLHRGRAANGRASGSN